MGSHSPGESVARDIPWRHRPRRSLWDRSFVPSRWLLAVIVVPFVTLGGVVKEFWPGSRGHGWFDLVLWSGITLAETVFLVGWLCRPVVGGRAGRPLLVRLSRRRPQRSIRRRGDALVVGAAAATWPSTAALTVAGLGSLTVGLLAARAGSPSALVAIPFTATFGYLLAPRVLGAGTLEVSTLGIRQRLRFRRSAARWEDIRGIDDGPAGDIVITLTSGGTVRLTTAHLPRAPWRVLLESWRRDPAQLGPPGLDEVIADLRSRHER